LDAFDFGGFDWGAAAILSFDSEGGFVPDLPLSSYVRFVDALEFGGVNGRNPSLEFVFALSCGVGVEVPVVRFELFEFAGVNGRFPAVEGPRASFGDIAGA